jgi:hypothetical protein
MKFLGLVLAHLVGLVALALSYVVWFLACIAQWLAND